jgi:sugar phosphate isomerase/epimerase
MDQGLNRRRFLGAAIGTGAAAAAAGAGAPFAFADDDDRRGRSGSGSVPRDRRSIQLYSLRRIMDRSQADAANMLRALGRMGYTEVETAGHYGWTAEEFRSVLRRYGLRADSGHDGPGFPAQSGWQTGYRESLEYAAELGQNFTGLAWFPSTAQYPYQSEATWHALADHLNEASVIAREFDLQFFYHNHDFEFSNKQANGEPMYNILLEETDWNLVKFELDLYWIVVGGESPVHYLADDPARYPLYHVKDKTWRDRPNEQDWEDAGPGSIDFPDIFAAGDGRRLDKHFIIEHDWPLLSHPNDEAAEFKTAQTGVEYLKNVRW